MTPSLQEPGSILVGPFLFSPKEFSLSAKGGSVEICVTFTPPGIGQFTEELHMACDNGQTLTYTLAGILVVISKLMMYIT